MVAMLNFAQQKFSDRLKLWKFSKMWNMGAKFNERQKTKKKTLV